ncbi:MAG: response regulator [Thermodesulfobacteriota bacterium]|nr:response regulator [Thermodesulfobacteriota bacterium]
MSEKINHRVLVVDDEEAVGKAIGRLLKRAGTDFVYARSAQDALETIKSAESPFSVILSDQRMPGMKGSEFLEKTRELSPDTIRFLLTGHSDVKALSEAVNKGAIQRYISKPWDNRVLLDMVRSGLDQFELIQENKRLFELAREQKKQLYQLNCDLKDSTARHKQALALLDKEISDLNRQSTEALKSRDFLGEIETVLKTEKMLTREKINKLWSAAISELFEQFQDIAARNGVEIPENLLYSEEDQ